MKKINSRFSPILMNKYVLYTLGISAVSLAVIGCSPSEDASNANSISSNTITTDTTSTDIKSTDKKLSNSITSTTSAKNTRSTEMLDRGFIAVPSEKGVLLSWRKLQDDAKDRAFDIYRDGQKISPSPINLQSNFLDTQGSASAVYELRDNQSKIARTTPWSQNYLSVAITPPPEGVTPDGQAYTYTANDVSVGDLDGDGQYELILKWDPTNSKDNAFGGYTGNTFIDAYTLEGKQLWRIDLGKNIRSGAHYTQFMVYDFDGDGRAEIAFKTADGTRDGAGKVIGDAEADWVTHAGELEVRDRTGSVVGKDGRLMGQLTGRILAGPEYFTVFEGTTGKALDTVPYIPQRAPNNDNPSPEELKAIWGDGYGNRSERYLAGVAYLDGSLPSAVMARGYYERTVVAAYDFRDGKISTRWVFDSTAPNMLPKYSGQGNHQLSVADVDGDGKDEIIYGSLAINHDGTPRWSTDLKHGDAMHVSDLDPTTPGLESFHVYESVRNNGGVGSALVSLNDGKILWQKSAEKDTGRGLAADIDPRHLGAEAWALNSPQLFSVKGETISEHRPAQVNSAVWWDGDLLRELLDGNKIYKWNWETEKSDLLLFAEGASSNNGTKQNPALSADILGDWREEVILRASDNLSLRIYSTAIPSNYGFTTLMQDHQYRLGVAWQNTSYNQPPHPSFYLGEGMQAK